MNLNFDVIRWTEKKPFRLRPKNGSILQADLPPLCFLCEKTVSGPYVSVTLKSNTGGSFKSANGLGKKTKRTFFCDVCASFWSQEVRGIDHWACK